ncbi:hypothetical protein K439DRAFT_446680 [Ramaria rubella]|nr:hypothetical protein K439DRAFT_446680 [Ramaria rubella]
MGDDHSTATHRPQPALVACMRSRPYAPSQYFPVLVRSSEWPGSLFFGSYAVLTLTLIICKKTGPGIFLGLQRIEREHSHSLKYLV